MAKNSAKLDGKRFGSEAKAANKGHVVDPNTLTMKQINPSTPAMRVSAGDPAADNVKTSGIKIRGTGAATKGTMARGPMA